MILARCPDCTTTFRVTPEQLKARGGKVRCGKCRSVFNALDTLVDEAREAPAPTLQGDPTPTERPEPANDTPAPITQIPEPAESKPESTIEADQAVDVATDILPPTPVAEPPLALEADAAALKVVAELAAPTPAPVADAATASPFLTPAELPAPLAATDDAGQGSIRDTREVPGYSKWAERAIAGSDAAAIVEAPGSARWPALMFSSLLLLALLGQAAYHFRSEIAARLPESRPWLLQACAAVGCTVPLPRQTDAISIEGSELQADNARGGLLILQASLRNRASFGQAYPALELTLTDTQDRMVSRRVLMPADYLAAAADPAGTFAAGSDLAIRLWIDARESGAAGYRLYVFHP